MNTASAIQGDRVFLKKRERNVATTATLVGLGLYEIAAGLLTQTQSPVEQAD